MRKYNKTIFILFLSVATIFSVYSKNFSVDDVCKSLTEYKVTSGDFVQEKSSPKLARPLKSSGTYIFSEDAILWNTVKPFKTATVITKTSITQIGANGKKPVMDGSSNEMFKTIAATLTAVFTGSKEALEEFFEISDFSSDSSSWKMTLTPKDKTVGSALQKLELSGAISAAEKISLDGMKVYQKDSNNTSYTLSNQKYSQALSDEQKILFN
ncbi:MAG: outer membrane lipoprotein carrier protein LolA [Treponema sp.]|nr:outer membrane lipoprotein carrier protein LolA [Candidatus Treponema equifaecale]